MPRRLKIGIVGCGAIGSSLAKAIVRDFSRRAELAALFDIEVSKAKILSKIVSGEENLAVVNLRGLITKSELVIEAASSRSSWEIARNSLMRGRKIMLMSVGGIIGHLPGLIRLAEKHDADVYIPSGAISGIDALKAAKLGRVKKAILITRKNPQSFKGVEYVQEQGINLDGLRSDKVLFFGSAQKAVKYFPQNINVAAVLSIAGIGASRTYVKIIASPLIRKNIHEVHIEAEAGNIFTRTENVLHPDNPKTSFLAVLSAIAVLKQILTPVKIGT